MSTPIDIYTYPEKATPIQLAEYQLEVMRAAERGEPVEWAMDSKDGYCGTPDPTWDWSEGCRYRIARPKIAEGHNPDKLTEAQVGVKDGWRLLTDAEVAACVESSGATAGIEYNRHSGCDSGKVSWLSNDTMGFHVVHGAEFRTKAAPGHYLPKPAAEPVAETRPGQLPVLRESEFETREETRRDRIAQAVRMIRDTSIPDDQVAAKIDAMLAREQSAPGLTLKDAREIIGQ